MSKSTERFVFVIDTDKYAGNFERETCAYVTGQLGECEVGEDEADLFEQAVSLGVIDANLEKEIENKILQVDDEGIFRPVEVWSTEQSRVDESPYPYNSVGIFFKQQPSKELIEFMKKRAQEFTTLKKDWDSDKYNILGFRLLKETTTTVEEELSI